MNVFWRLLAHISLDHIKKLTVADAAMPLNVCLYSESSVFEQRGGGGRLYSATPAETHILGFCAISSKGHQNIVTFYDKERSLRTYSDPDFTRRDQWTFLFTVPFHKYFKVCILCNLTCWEVVMQNFTWNPIRPYHRRLVNLTPPPPPHLLQTYVVWRTHPCVTSVLPFIEICNANQ